MPNFFATRFKFAYFVCILCALGVVVSNVFIKSNASDAEWISNSANQNENNAFSDRGAVNAGVNSVGHFSIEPESELEIKLPNERCNIVFDEALGLDPKKIKALSVFILSIESSRWQRALKFSTASKRHLQKIDIRFLIINVVEIYKDILKQDASFNCKFTPLLNALLDLSEKFSQQQNVDWDAWFQANVKLHSYNYLSQILLFSYIDAESTGSDLHTAMVAFQNAVNQSNVYKNRASFITGLYLTIFKGPVIEGRKVTSWNITGLDLAASLLWQMSELPPNKWEKLTVLAALTILEQQRNTRLDIESHLKTLSEHFDLAHDKLVVRWLESLTLIRHNFIDFSSIAIRFVEYAKQQKDTERYLWLLLESDFAIEKAFRARQALLDAFSLLHEIGANRQRVLKAKYEFLKRIDEEALMLNTLSELRAYSPNNLALQIEWYDIHSQLKRGSIELDSEFIAFLSDLLHKQVAQGDEFERTQSLLTKAYKNRAERYFSLGDFSQSQEDLLSLLEMEESVGLMDQLGESAMLNGSPEVFIQTVEAQFNVLLPSLDEMYTRYLAGESVLGNLEEADQELTIDLLLRYASAKDEVGDTYASIEILKLLDDVGYSNPASRNNLAESYRLVGDYETAESIYMSQLETDENPYFTRKNLALLNVARGDMESANAYLVGTYDHIENDTDEAPGFTLVADVMSVTTGRITQADFWPKFDGYIARLKPSYSTKYTLEQLMTIALSRGEDNLYEFYNEVYGKVFALPPF